MGWTLPGDEKNTLREAEPPSAKVAQGASALRQPLIDRRS